MDPGIKINGEYIRDVLLKQEKLPDIVQFLAISSFFSWTVHPPADTACETVAYCSDRFCLSLLPICDLPTAPVSYKVWDMMQDRVYWAKVRDVGDLKQRLIDVWDSLEQSVIDDAIDQWRSRLLARVHAKGGHFEQSF